MYRLTLLIIVVAILLSGCDAIVGAQDDRYPVDIYPFKITTGGSAASYFFYCKEFNEALRIGYSCVGYQSYSEYHLGANDSWQRR